MKSTCLAVFGVIASSLLGASAGPLPCTKCGKAPPVTPPATTRPIYAIANRVLEAKYIETALDHGANAIEIDATAWSTGWWADHDGLPTSAGDTMVDMFKSIANARREAKNINFVWLEIRNPDYCSPEPGNKWYLCSVGKLNDLVTRYLEPAGVPVLFSFSGKGAGYEHIKKNLGRLNAISLRGKAADVKGEFASENIETLPLKKRVMNYGYFDWASEFHHYRAELEEGVKSEAFGKVFGWTYAGGRKTELDSVLGSGVDGLVYGFKHTAYYDHADARLAINDIKDWVEENKDTAHLATLDDDTPWQ